MGCEGCRRGDGLDFDFTMAFQPIVDLNSGGTYAYEALVRGPSEEPAPEILSRVTPTNLYVFDQRCRVKAIEVAARAGILATDARLSINFLPNAVYSPQACIQLTLKTAAAAQFPTSRLIFEFTENEQIVDPDHLANIVATYRRMGFGTALDDFGAGHAGLALLARFQTDTVKLDRELIRGIDGSLSRRLIVEALVRMCQGLGIRIVAEGVETEEELATLKALGIGFAPGFLFARPAFERLPNAIIPPSAAAIAA